MSEDQDQTPDVAPLSETPDPATVDPHDDVTELDELDELDDDDELEDDDELDELEDGPQLFGAYDQTLQRFVVEADDDRNFVEGQALLLGSETGHDVVVVPV